MSARKSSILFVEGGVIKVVAGNVLKTVRFEDVSLPHNKKFFDLLFADTTVLFVEKATPLSMEQFFEFVGERPVQPAQDATPARASLPAAMVSRPSPVIQQKTTKLASPQTPSIPDSGAWVRSTIETFLVVDDLFTGEEIPGRAPGLPSIKKALSIPPGRPIDLSRLDPEVVRKSSILRDLLRNGWLVKCTASEARAYEVAWQKKQAREAEENDRLSGLDTPIIDRDDVGRNGFRVINDEDPNTFDTTDAGMPRLPSNEDSGSMDELMRQMAEAEEERMLFGSKDDVGIANEESAIQPRERVPRSGPPGATIRRAKHGDD